VTRLHSHVHLFRLYLDSAVSEEALDEQDGIIDAIELSDSRAARRDMRTT
jgi:DNA-binding GntR family transcriptional regulator